MYEGEYDVGLPSREARVTSTVCSYKVMNAETETCLETPGGGSGDRGRSVQRVAACGEGEEGKKGVAGGAALVVSLTFSFFRNKGRAEANMAKC